MKIKLKTLILVWAVVILLMLYTLPAKASLYNRITLSGGSFSTKSLSVWELEKYKRTALIRKGVLKWCPWRAYVEINKHVHIITRENKNWIIIDTNITSLVIDDARYNKTFSKTFNISGTKLQILKQIYKYCYRTNYKVGVKSAREVFSNRVGDCSAIAAAFYVLCKGKHIPVKYVVGWTSFGCHAWNRIKLKNKWYWICATQGFWLQRKLPKGWKVMDIW